MNPEMSYASQNEPPASAPPAQGFFSRLMGVYFSPTETFQDVGRSPGVLIPIIALVVLTLITTVIFFNKLPVNQMMNQRMEEMVQEGRLTQEQADQQQEQMKKMEPIMKIATPFIAAITMVIITLIVAGIAKLISMVMGVENSFMPVWSVAIYTTLAVSIITSVIFLILVFVKPVDEFDMNNPLGSNIAALLPALGMGGLPKFVTALLSYVDIFYIWKVILLGIGFSAVSKKLKSSTAITITAIVSVFFALGGAAWTSMFG